MPNIIPYVKAIIRYYVATLIIFANSVMYSMFNVINIKSKNKSLLISYILFMIIIRIDNCVHKIFNVKNLLMLRKFIKTYYSNHVESVIYSVLLDDVVYYVYNENISVYNLFNEILSKEIFIGGTLNSTKCNYHKSIKYMGKDYLNLFNKLICSNNPLICDVLSCVTNVHSDDIVRIKDIFVEDDECDGVCQFIENKRIINIKLNINNVY